MTFLQVFLQCRGDGGTTAVSIVGHLVKPLAVVVVLQLAERCHTSIEVVVDDGKAVAVVVKGFPTGEIKVLGVVGQIHAPLQHILTAHRRKRVEVKADDEIGIVGYHRGELVVNHLLVEFQLVEL